VGGWGGADPKSKVIVRFWIAGVGGWAFCFALTTLYSDEIGWGAVVVVSVGMRGVEWQPLNLLLEQKARVSGRGRKTP
jgi:hypothetical protein